MSEFVQSPYGQEPVPQNGYLVAQGALASSPEAASAAMSRVHAAGPRAWLACSLTPSAWQMTFPAAALRELLSHPALRDPGPVAEIAPASAATMPACAAFMRDIRRRLLRGPGLSLVSGLPIDELGDGAALRAYWLLGALLSRPVATKWDGTVLYDVRDSGRRFGRGVRGSATDVELAFHTDNAFGSALPDFVGLLCLQQARSGGISQVCSLYAVHEAMRLRCPDLLARLYRPAFYDRQNEHAADAPAVLSAPLFSHAGGRLSARLTPNLIRNGYAMLGRELDTPLAQALEALQTLLSEPRFRIEFGFQRGQVQWLNNHWIAHYRSAFIDASEPARRRHLIRVWYRDHGGLDYDAKTRPQRH